MSLNTVLCYKNIDLSNGDTGIVQKNLSAVACLGKKVLRKSLKLLELSELPLKGLRKIEPLTLNSPRQPGHFATVVCHSVTPPLYHNLLFRICKNCTTDNPSGERCPIRATNSRFSSSTLDGSSSYGGKKRQRQVDGPFCRLRNFH